jgi:hypothetical protein
VTRRSAAEPGSGLGARRSAGVAATEGKATENKATENKA